MKRCVVHLIAVAVMFSASAVARADFILGVAAQPDPSFAFGVRVIGVTPNAPAQALGLQVDDLLYNLNGINLITTNDLYNAMQASDGSITLSLFRAGANITVQASLINVPGAGTARTRGVKVTNVHKIKSNLKPPARKKPA